MKNLYSNTPSLFLIFTLLILSLTSGCLLPKSPGKFVISKTQTLKHFNTKLYTINNERDTHDGNIQIYTPKRNLLYIAVDETMAPQYSPILKQAYKTDKDIFIEDVSWWKFAPKMRGVYDKVLLIERNQFHLESLKQAIQFLENQKHPYDIYFLTHGFPNHIPTSRGHNVISYEDIEALKPHVTKLQFVFMQGCFSSTLAPDFHLLGAQEILSYDGWNRNFFYIDYFLDYYKSYRYDVKRAFDKTNQKLPGKMKRSFLYKKVLEVLNMTVDDYLEIAPPPLYSNASES